MAVRAVSPPLASRAALRPQVAIRSYATLSEAERAVELLARRSFPGEYVEVAARGLRRCTHRQHASPLLTAVAGCGVMGAAVAVAAGLIGIDPAGDALAMLALFGAAVGSTLAWLVSAFLARSRRDCQCSRAVAADAYDGLVQAVWATDADKVLAVPEEEGRRLRGRTGLYGP